MRSFIVYTGIIILLWSCDSNAKKVNTSSQTESSIITAEYNQNEFRRFTYFFQTESDEILQVFDSEVWQNCKNLSSQNDIKDINAYRKENDYFIVIDAIPSLDGAAVHDIVSTVEPLKSLHQALQMLSINFSAPKNGVERIYKLNQKVVYTPEEGQLKTDIGNHKRFVWTLLLEPEHMDEYRRVHGIGQAWPEITQNMLSIGVRDMEIYLHDTQAILIMDTNPDFDLDEVSPRWQKLPRENEWQEYVAKFQRTKPGSSIQEKWLDMIAL